MTQQEHLQKMRDAAERFLNRAEYRRPPNSEAQNEYIKNYARSLHAPKSPAQQYCNNFILQVESYERVRAEFLRQAAIREEEVCILKQDHGFRWIFDKENGPTIKTLIQWFANDKACQIPLHKGFYLFGNIGCGKTETVQMLLRAAETLQLPKAALYTNLSDLYEDGAAMHEQYQQIRVFDELGRKTGEIYVKSGKINPVESVIEARNKRFVKYGQLTCFISNAEPNQCRELVSGMAFDRIRQMATSIRFFGDSKR